LLRGTVVVAIACLACVTQAAWADDTSSFAQKLKSLATTCDDLGLKEQAEITRRWNVPRYPGRQYLFLPLAADPTPPKATAPETARQWHRRFLEIRREQAAALFAAAKEASQNGEPTKAYQQLFEVLREDPDHAEARRVLGYVQTSRGQWQLAGAERMAAETTRADQPRLRWPAGSYYRLETPHFQIVSNHSKPELLEAGQQLEKLAALWRQIYFRYWSTPQALAARLAGGREALAPPRPKMQVVVFRSRQEYAAHVSTAHPKAAATLGLYDDKQRIAYFYAGDTSVYPTWYHEATHQLFTGRPAAARQTVCSLLAIGSCPAI
jgi:tetratricopeptide (TPR) repeat protein